MGDILVEQFDKYLADVEEESKANLTIFRESLFDRTCAIIANALEDLELFGEAKKIRKARDDHRK